MKHQDIVQLVKSMEIRDLTKATFEDFVQGAHGLFVPKGARFQEFYGAGYNNKSKDKYDFSKGKPNYREVDVLIFDRIEPKEIKDQGKKWINVHFDKDTGTWGIPHSGRLPLKFGYDPGKALYIAEQSGNGTPDQPYETLYLKLE